jgi:hypothetical protein
MGRILSEMLRPFCKSPRGEEKASLTLMNSGRQWPVNDQRKLAFSAFSGTTPTGLCDMSATRFIHDNGVL